MGVIDTVYDIGDKLDCSCSIGSPDGDSWLFCWIVGFICWIVGCICCAIGSCKSSADVGVDCVACATATPFVGGRLRQSESIPSETSIFADYLVYYCLDINVLQWFLQGLGLWSGIQS